MRAQQLRAAQSRKKGWTIKTGNAFAEGIDVRILRGKRDDNFVTTTLHLVFGPEGQSFTVPEGFRLDFASIPAAFRGVISKTDGRICLAAFVHDWLYSCQIVTRREADRIFLDIMKEDGMPFFKRRAAWLAVRPGGGRAWNEMTSKMK